MDNIQPKTKPKTPDEVKTLLNRFCNDYEPKEVLFKVGKNLDHYKKGVRQIIPENDLFKAMTLLEFRNGTLLVTVVSEEYRTFAIDMMRKLQQEYNCVTTSEQATTELVTVNYIRTLEIQYRITAYLDKGSVSDTGVKFLDIMSKELDRANRHYLAAIQALRMLKHPPLNVNIKTNTAIVGQNQLIQENQHVKPI